MFDDTWKLELLLVDFSDIRHTLTFKQLILLDQVVSNVSQLCISRIIEVWRYWNAIVWLESERKQLIVHNDYFSHVDIFKNAKVFDVDGAWLLTWFVLIVVRVGGLIFVLKQVLQWVIRWTGYMRLETLSSVDPFSEDFLLRIDDI